MKKFLLLILIITKLISTEDNYSTLGIAKVLVDKHDGSILFLSDIGKGYWAHDQYPAIRFDVKNSEVNLINNFGRLSELSSNDLEKKYIISKKKGVYSTGTLIFKWEPLDHLIEIFDKNEMLLATLYLYTNGIVIITPEGYFTYQGSNDVTNFIKIPLNLKVSLPLSNFYDTFYRPDLVKKKLSGEDISKYTNITMDDVIKNIPPTVQITKIKSNQANRKTKVCYKINSNGSGGIGEVRLYHNGKLFYSDGNYQTSQESEKGQKKIEEITTTALYDGFKRSLKVASKEKIGASISPEKPNTVEECQESYSVNGENEYVALAYNKTNTISSEMAKASVIIKSKAEKPKLYVVSIGINKFIDSKNNLTYAAKDAQDFAQQIKAQAKTLYALSDIVEPIILTDDKATKKNIIQTIKSLSTKVRPEDRVIIFIASHGIVLEGSYYVIAHNYDGVIKDESMIGSNEFVDMIKEIPSFNQLMVIDTCHAGGIDKIINGLYDSKISRLAKKTGLHIYASANSKQEALDGYQKNGLFTHTLLKGLNNNKAADRRKRNFVSVTDLGEYSKEETKKISERLGHEQTPIIINFGNDFDLYKLN